MTEPVLEVDGLETRFYTDEGTVNAVDDVSFSLNDGEILGIVGESGSGKSVTSLSILGLINDPGQIEAGTIRYQDTNLTDTSEKKMRSIRGSEISMVFQDPMTSLNPVFTVGQQISRVIRHHQDLSKEDAREKTIELLADVGIPDSESRVDTYPHQLSGGMRQRALIAMAISCEPEVLIADEPTTALDVTIEAQIFELISDLQEKYGMSVILITHDLGVVAETCDQVNVMYAGKIVEHATVEELFENPRHPYTRGLMRSVPRLGSSESSLMAIEGDVPNPASLPAGCSFNPRCPHATETCQTYDPELREVEPGQEAACIHARGYGLISSDGSNVQDDATASTGETTPVAEQVSEPPNTQDDTTASTDGGSL